MMRSGPTNYQLNLLLTELEPRARASPFWRKVADDLRKPARQRRMVNVYKIQQYAQDGETIVVPGKVLSVGELTKKVTVAAVNFSTEARKKIDAQGKTLTIGELLRQNPEGRKVRILG